jgi:hypothetical protein
VEKYCGKFAGKFSVRENFLWKIFPHITRYDTDHAVCKRRNVVRQSAVSEGNVLNVWAKPWVFADCGANFDGQCRQNCSRKITESKRERRREDNIRNDLKQDGCDGRTGLTCFNVVGGALVSTVMNLRVR